MVKRRVLGVQKSDSASGKKSNVGSSSNDRVDNNKNEGSIKQEKPNIGTIESHVSDIQGSTEILCPICSEKMLTLAQLNQHLDDEHSLDSDNSGDSGENYGKKTSKWERRKTNKNDKTDRLFVSSATTTS